ncbi:MAG: ChaN family lipoprotein [Myxococcales bacterium]|nr:ChaN family lipoprotein [Myxococcales bacterium]
MLQLPLGSAPHDMLRLHRGEIIETASGRPFSLEVLAVALQSADIVLVGEQHDHREHHAIQGRIISALAARGPSLVVGLEMLQRDDDEARALLARYTEREIDEATFAKKLRFKKRWGLRFDVYAPVFRAARAHRLRVFGLNAPRAVVRSVARVGLHNLTTLQRERLPSRIDLHVAPHRRLFAAMLGGGHHHHLASAKLDRYYGAQCVWDASMAEAAIALARPRSKFHSRVVVIAGGGHVYYDLGIALRIRKRRPALKVASIALVSVAHRHGRDVSRGLATYIIGTAPAPAHKKK